MRAKAFEAQLAAMLKQQSDERCPSRLVTGAQACSAVAMKELVKWDAVAPVLVGLEKLVVAEHGSASRCLVAHEDLPAALEEMYRAEHGDDQ